MFKYLGLILVLSSWFGGAYLVTKWRGTKAMSLSLHAASNKTALRLFATVLVGLGLLFYFWLVKWFVPYLSLSGAFVPLLTLTVACQCAAGIVADTEGWSRKVHYVAAYTMAYLYLPLGILILFAHGITPLAKGLGAICLTWMVVALLLCWFVKRTRPHYLVFQSSYIIAFQLIIVFAAYLK
jgi:hypothetical protein